MRFCSAEQRDGPPAESIQKECGISLLNVGLGNPCTAAVLHSCSSYPQQRDRAVQELDNFYTVQTTSCEAPKFTIEV